MAERVALLYNLQQGGHMRAHKIMVRMNDEEKTLIDQASSGQGLNTSAWSRMELIRAARGCQPDKSENKSQISLPLLSLFCGAGGLDEGFRQAGFSTQLAIDIDKECINTFKANHPNAKTYKCDIRNLDLSSIDEVAGNKIEPIGVIGGPPCQSFSVSNVYQKDNDPRHELPEVYADLLGNLNKRSPISFFVFENVPGLLGKKHKPRYDWFKKLFSKCGFELHENLLNALDYGVPQDRPRIIIIGINRELYPAAVWSPPEKENGIRTLTVRDIISGLPEPVFNSPGLDPNDFPVHPNHWCLVPRSKKFKDKKKLVEGQAYGRSFRTLAWDKPSWTVAYGHREVHVHPNGKRRLSMYEALLLQSFPKTYRLTGNMTAQINLVSEAVPPRLAWYVACSIRRCLGI